LLQRRIHSTTLSHRVLLLLIPSGTTTPCPTLLPMLLHCCPLSRALTSPTLQQRSLLLTLLLWLRRRQWPLSHLLLQTSLPHLVSTLSRIVFQQALRGPRIFLPLRALLLPVLLLLPGLLSLPGLTALVLLSIMSIVSSLTSSLPCKMNLVCMPVNWSGCCTSMTMDG
jgi:hypothetical protein